MSQRRHLPGMAALPSLPQPRGGARPYRRGSRAERELQRDLARDGALVIRSAASLGPFDLYVLAEHGGTAIQCKCCAGEPTPTTVARWWAALPPLPPGWTAELWIKVGRRGWRRGERTEDAS